jgi:hypothetical protein
MIGSMGGHSRRLAIPCLLAATVVASPAAAAVGWDIVDSMPSGRTYPGSAVLGDRWFVAGGTLSMPSRTAPVIVYDAAVPGWREVAPSGAGGDWIPAATDPTHGQVLFVGESFDGYETSDAFLGDGNGWTMSRLVTPRTGHALAFAAGKFVVSGGWGSIPRPGGGGADSSPFIEMAVADSESLDASGTTWTSAGAMPGGPRIWHRMTTLADGHRILVTGGCLPDGALKSADILDVATMSWSKAADMDGARCRHGAVLLRDGRVLVTGALLNQGLEIGASAELYDPVSDRWSPAAPMHDARFEHATLALPDGRVLVVGGTNDARDGEVGALASAELYDPSSDSWTILPSLHDARRSPAAAVLSDGVYVTGGSSAAAVPSIKDPNVPESGPVQLLASTERLAFAAIPSGGAATTAVPETASSGATSSGGGCTCGVAPRWQAGGARTATSGLSALVLLAFAILSRTRRRRL